MKTNLAPEQFHRIGFDLTRRTDDGTLRLGCSQCDAIVIMGTPCHETGCPNAVQECKGCNALVPRNAKYCEDCA